MLGSLCVTSSLALGGSDPTSRFHLRTLSIAGPLVIMGPILDMVVISHDVEGASCGESRWCINSCLLPLFIALATARRFASSVVTPWGYKASGRSYAQFISSRTISHRLHDSFPTAEKKER
jgi:hypothetical protein